MLIKMPGKVLFIRKHMLIIDPINERSDFCE
jgi:hypothetical protein